MPISHRMPPSLLSPHERRVNIVVLSTCTPTNAYVINAVAARHPIRHVFRVTWDDQPRSESRLAKFARAPIGSVVRTVRRKYFERAHNRTEALAGSLLPELRPAAQFPPITPVDRLQVNSARFAEELRALNPDVLLVTAGPILKPRIFEIPKLATINVHRGIAPAYRGERTLFWALANNDLDNIGVTLHRIDRGIDTGSVLKYGYPALDPRDTEASITAKAMQLAAVMVGDALDEAELSGLHGATQPSAGRCYYARDQRTWQEARFQCLRMLGRRRIEPREQRIVTMTPSAAISEQSAELRPKRVSQPALAGAACW